MAITPELIESYKEGHPALLEQLGIATPKGHLKALFGLGGQVFVSPRNDTHQLRRDMLQNLEAYYLRFKNRLTHYRECTQTDLDGKNCKLLEASPFSKIMEQMEPWPKNYGYSGVIWESYAHPEFKSDAGTVNPLVACFIAEAETIKNELSEFEFYLPITSDGKLNYNFKALFDTFLDSCQRLRPAHGSAGFCVVLEIGDSSGEKHAYSTLRRHPGFNILQGSTFSLCSAGVFNRIKTIDWLTVLSDEIIDELGGLSAVRKVLEPECIFHLYPGGVVIQAGAVPQLGDVTTNNWPSAYRKVSNFTKPVRFEDYSKFSLFNVFPPLDPKEETLKWVKRFD